MERSIESIWKEGFLASDALVAPKLNKLYKQKSMHLIDKYKRMFKINLNAILVGSFLFLGVSFLIGTPFMGIGFFLTLSIIVLVNRRLAAGLNKIDKSANSYHYIKSFNDWMKQQISVNRLMARFYYPLFFFSIVLGLWQYSFNGKQFGETITNKLGLSYPDINLIYGVPLFIIFGVTLMMLILSYLGGRIYNWDLKIVYGGVLRKLDEIIVDMEALKNE